MSTVFVTFCDHAYFHKAKKTIYELRTLGKWKGDVVLMAIDFNPPQMDDVILYKTSHIPTDPLLRFYEKHPFTKGDRRHLSLLVQWDKLQVFSYFFRQWERVIVLDAGMRVLSDVSPILSLDWRGSFLAPDDGNYPYNPNVTFQTQLDTTASPETYQKLLQEYSETILNRRAFVPCVFVYDTALLDRISCLELMDTMYRYPIGTCNEMMIMNLIFNCKYNVWKPFPMRIDGKYAFGWNESHQNDTPGTWRDFIFMKYPFYTPTDILGDSDTVFVTLCDKTYHSKAVKTIEELQTNGLWGGDIVLIAVDFEPEHMKGVTIYKTTHVDTSKLFEQWKTHPIQALPDNRHYGKIYQWDKLQVFKKHFQKWKRVVFLDAGLRIFNSVQPLLDLDWKGKLLAPDDAHPNDNGNRYRTQLDHTANPEVTQKLFSEYPQSICDEHYFNNPIFVYDTKILNTMITFDELIQTMNKYPIFMCNETGLMNLIFNYKLKIWQTFPEKVGNKILFGWAENNYPGSNWSDFHFIKYSLTRA